MLAHPLSPISTKLDGTDTWTLPEADLGRPRFGSYRRPAQSVPMHFFRHHIGDHMRIARHLSMLEEGAFLRLASMYFDTERPLPADIDTIYRRALAKTKDERKAIDTVLQDCFTLCEDGWRQAAIDQQISDYKELGQAKSRAAKKRWDDEAERKRLLESERNANGMHMHSARIANQKPKTKNLETKNRQTRNTHSQPEAEWGGGVDRIRPKGAYPDEFVKFWNAAPRRKNVDKAKTFEEYKSAVAYLVDHVADPHAFLIEKIKLFAAHYLDTPTIYVTNAKNWLRDLRWEDEYPDVD